MATFYRVNFQTATNEDFRQAFALTDSDGNPVDLTGGSLKITFDGLANTHRGTAALEASTANGRIVLANAGLGQFEINVPTAVLHTIPPGVYRHDLLLTLSGRVKRVWEGTLTLAEGVTP
jgi:hypothetical protein